MGKRIIKLTESDLERIVRRVIKEDDASPMDRFIEKMKENPTKGNPSGVHPLSQEVYKDDNWTIAELNSLSSDKDLFGIKEALRYYGLGTEWIFTMYLNSNNDKSLTDYLKRVGPTYFIIPSNGDKSEKFLFNPEINYLVNSRGNNVDVSDFDGGVAEFIEDKLNNQQDDMGNLAESKKRVVKLTESQLVNIIERVIKEEGDYGRDDIGAYYGDLQMKDTSGFRAGFRPNRFKDDSDYYKKNRSEKYVSKKVNDIIYSDEVDRLTNDVLYNEYKDKTLGEMTDFVLSQLNIEVVKPEDRQVIDIVKHKIMTIINRKNAELLAASAAKNKNPMDY